MVRDVVVVGHGGAVGMELMGACEVLELANACLAEQGKRPAYRVQVMSLDGGPLERAVLSAFTMARPCDRKGNSPPGPTALAAAAKLLGPEGNDVVIDLAAYQAIAEGAGR